MINEKNQVYLNDKTILLTNQGLHITPDGFRSIVITIQKIQIGQVVHSASVELDLLEFQDLIDRLETWEKQFHTIKFVEKEEQNENA